MTDGEGVPLLEKLPDAEKLADAHPLELKEDELDACADCVGVPSADMDGVETVDAVTVMLKESETVPLPE